jgi:hypothetical protein
VRMRPNVRGSRKHVLDWVERPTFPADLLALASPVRCEPSDQSMWMPESHDSPGEARLEDFGPAAMPGHHAWTPLSSWWLRHHRGANTPNWDLALSCLVESRPGLVLVEAKANEPELSPAGKRPAVGSDRSCQNHDHISLAITEAREALAARFPSISIGRDRHYQLSNRIAFAWKLATLGVPTVLIYIGFLGDTGVANVGAPFRDDGHWQRTFASHLAEICSDPSATSRFRQVARASGSWFDRVRSLRSRRHRMRDADFVSAELLRNGPHP